MELQTKQRKGNETQNVCELKTVPSMQVPEKSKSKKRKQKKKKTVPGSEKLNVSTILDRKQWDGASNWLQLIKATGMKVKQKDPPNILEEFCNPMSSRNQNKTFHKQVPSKPSTDLTSHGVNGSRDSDPLSNDNNSRKIERNGVLKPPSTNSSTNSNSNVKEMNTKSLGKETFKFGFKNSQYIADKPQDGIRPQKLTKAVAMDCEMVGTGPNGAISIVARVSIVNSKGECLYDEFVKAKEQVTDYRTRVSGVRPADLLKGKDLFQVQQDVVKLLEGKILVGHALKHDFDVLFINHPRSKIRDTSNYQPFRKLCGGCTPSLKKLSNFILGVAIQKGEHSSVEDARAAMQIYLMHKHEWETHLKLKRKTRKNKETKSIPTADPT